MSDDNNLLFIVQTHIDTSTKLHNELAEVMIKLQETEKRVARWSLSLVKQIFFLSCFLFFFGYMVGKIPFPPPTEAFQQSENNIKDNVSYPVAKVPSE